MAVPYIQPQVGQHQVPPQVVHQPEFRRKALDEHLRKNSEEYVKHLDETKRALNQIVEKTDMKIRETEQLIAYANQFYLDALYQQKSLNPYGTLGGLGSGALIGTIVGVFGFIAGSTWGAIALASGLGGGLALGGGIGYAYDNDKEKHYNEKVNQIGQQLSHYQSSYRSLVDGRENLFKEIGEIGSELDKMMPQLEVKAVFDKLIEETYSPVELVVSNKDGKGPAYDVRCKIRGPIDGEREVKFGRIEMEKVSKTLSLKPTDRGKMRWIFEIHYKDCLDRYYEEEQEQWIDSKFFAPATEINVGQIISGDVHGDAVVGKKEGGVSVKTEDHSTKVSVQDSVLMNPKIGAKK